MRYNFKGAMVVERLRSIGRSGFRYLVWTLKLCEDPRCCTLRRILLR